MKVSDLEARAWNLAHAGLDLDATFMAFDELLRPHVPYAIASWSTHDPATGLFTSCTMSGAPKDPVAEARLFRCEFTAGEPSSYRSLIGRHEPPAILSQATDGELDRATRYRDIFAPFGLTDELRAVLWADGTAWGSATLLRADGRFEARDVDAVTAIARHAADGIRLALLRGAANRPEVVEEPPGVVEVLPDGQVTPVTAPAELGGSQQPTSRSELAALLQFEQYDPRVWGDIPPSPYGGFLESRPVPLRC